MYKTLIRPLFFKFDPEKIHTFSLRCMALAARVPGALALISCITGARKKDPRLQRNVFGLAFNSPVGLAGGFDKEGEAFETFAALGFAFVEVGTITPRSQPGNPRPRIFRLPRDRALINRMGFNNSGVDHLVKNISKRRFPVILGGNIGKNKDTPNEDAVSDYEQCFEKLFPYVDFFTVNISSPNTPGLRALQDREPLEKLLTRLEELNRAKPNRKPLLLKVAPDMEFSQLDDVLEVMAKVGVDGIIATNTTIGRDNLSYSAEEVAGLGAGGLSGAPLTKRSTEVVRYLAQKTEGRLPIVAVGGIMTAQDALEMFKAGASLVQLYTGFVYGGPALIKEIEQAVLAEAL